MKSGGQHFSRTALFLSLISLIASSAVAADTPTETTIHYARVAGVASDQLSVDLEVGPPNDCKSIHLVVRDTVVKDRLKQLQRGDRITVVYSSESSGQNLLKIFCVDAASPGPGAFTRAWILLVSAGLCLLLGCLFSGFSPSKLIIGIDNRYSNSKFQIAAWFFVLITTYIATLWIRVWYAGWDFLGGVNIPQNLLLLSGMSALTFGGAAGITSQKVAQARAGGVADPKNAAAAQPSFFVDLTHNDGSAAGPGVAAVAPQFDFGDFQMFVITLIAIATYLVLVFNFLGTIEESRAVSLPDVDTTILAAFSLGHGAYLTKKAVGNVGQS